MNNENYRLILFCGVSVLFGVVDCIFVLCIFEDWVSFVKCG